MQHRELSYSVISNVIESWENLRRQKDYEEHAGSLLFQRLFEKCKEAKVLFGFSIDIDPSSPELVSSKRFLMHATYLISMIDTALNMLGPDAEMLTEIMIDLGKKHVRYGVKAEYFPFMGEALLETLVECLPDKMTDEVQGCWRKTYAILSEDMIRGMSS